MHIGFANVSVASSHQASLAAVSGLRSTLVVSGAQLANHLYKPRAEKAKQRKIGAVSSFVMSSAKPF